ncbi:MAG: hypothetical protein M8354_14575, partial [Halalkalicoccus sp.]|nr:hypothetical protein [Halalkalicoccus sp.]
APAVSGLESENERTAGPIGSTFRPLNALLPDGVHTMTSHIKLYGSKGDLFEELKERLTNDLGYEPSNPEVVGLLMSGYDSDADRLSSLSPLPGSDGGGRRSASGGAHFGRR